jgi:exosome complex protein LRP1
LQPGHDKSDLERAEKEAKEKALAQLRAMKLAKKNAISQQTSAKERSSRSTNSGLPSASEPDSHPNRRGSERGVPLAEAPATTAQQPSVKNKNTAKEKAKERRERFKASEATRKLQNQLGKKGDGSEPQKAKGSGRKSRRAAKAAARRKRGRHDKETS